MTENFNLGYQKIIKLLPTIKKKLDSKTSIIIALIEAYIEFSKITIGIDIQGSFNWVLEIEKRLTNIIPKDHNFFEIIL